MITKEQKDILYVFLENKSSISIVINENVVNIINRKLLEDYTSLNNEIRISGKCKYSQYISLNHIDWDYNKLQDGLDLNNITMENLMLNIEKALLL